MKKTIKKVPIILQMEALECGAASLCMILAYYKKYVPLEQIRSDCNVSRDGSSAKYITIAAKYHGLQAKAFRMSVDKIRERKDFPMIIHWNFNHFVVLCGFDKETAIINDPASGRERISSEEFDRCFTGIAISFQPSESFTPSGVKHNGILSSVKRLKGNRAPLIVIITMGLIISVLELTKPVFYKIFTDQILLGNTDTDIKPLMIIMGIVLVLSFSASLMQSIYLAKMKARMTIQSSSNILWHILHLPIDFFSQRFAGDIADRVESNEEIAEILCTQLVPVVLDVFMAGIYLIVLLSYNISMALLGFTLALVNLFLVFFTSRNNADEIKNVQRDAGRLSGVVISVISMIETIKASGAEEGFFEKTTGTQTKYNNSKLKLRRQNAIQRMIPQIISGLSSGVILIVGIGLIFNGKFTIGSLMAFQSLMSLFLTPIGNFTDALQSLQTVNSNIERMNDVFNYPVETRCSLKGMDVYEKLSGRIDIHDLCFAYGRLAPNLIDHFHMHVEPGHMVALVGGSGCGKSTIAKIVSGLYKPSMGDVMFDGRSIAQIDRDVFSNSVAVIDQNISLFSGTIRENITMWNSMITEETVIEACKDACIHDDIMGLPGGYDAMIAEDGKNFSGGQKQRLEIARALAAQPSILIMDEATSALDPVTEAYVMQAVKKRNITCLVIAHRLSTIRDADEIILLEYGKEIERGTHEELIAQNGQYKALVSSE